MPSGAMTPAERQARAKAKKLAAGLKPLRLWLPPSVHAQVRRFAERIMSKTTIDRSRP